MNIKTQNAINDIYDLLQDDLRSIINKINEMPAVTRNNYGNYYSQIIKLKEITNLNYKIIALLLYKAGGNKNGINDAMKVINI